MVSKLVYSILSADAELRSLLGSTPAESRIKPLFTSLTNRTIVYRVVPVSCDGVFIESSLELRIIDNDAEILTKLTDRVMSLLVMSEQQPPITYPTDGSTIVLYSCMQNGGGQLNDDVSIHTLIYFDIKWRFK